MWEWNWENVEKIRKQVSYSTYQMQLKKQTRLKRNANACAIKCTLVPTYAFNIRTRTRTSNANANAFLHKKIVLRKLTTLEYVHACALKEAHFFNVWIYSVDLLVCLIFSVVWLHPFSLFYCQVDCVLKFYRGKFFC